MQKFFHKFAVLSLTGLMFFSLITPAAFAKTATSAATAIEESTESVDDMTATGGDFDTAAELDSATKVGDFFEELGSLTDKVKSEIRAITRPVSQADFDIAEEAYDDFLSEVTTALSRADNLITTGTAAQTEFTAEKSRFKDDDELDKLKDAFTTLESSITGSTTTTTTSSAKVNTAVEDIETATENVDDLSSDVDAITSQTLLDAFFENLISEADDVIRALKTITGSITSADYDNIDTSVSEFTDEVNSRFTRLTARTGSGGTITSLRTSFIEQKSEYRDDQKDEITTQMDRISRLAFGTSAGSSIINSTVSKIEDFEADIDTILEDELGVNTEAELSDYMESIIDVVKDVVKEVKKITGTITQNNFDDLEDAVSNFKSAVTDARNAVRTNSTAADFEEEYENQKDELADESEKLDTAMDVVEALIGALNTSTTFTDVPSTSEFARYIAALASNNIVSGFSDRTFHPKRNVTRAEFLKMALLGARRNVSISQTAPSPFTDVVATHSLKAYINYAVANNIVNGQTVGGLKYFYPERSISRAEAMIILLRINLIAPGTATVSRFSDVRDPEQMRYIEVAAARGIINGYTPTTFGPNDFLTREQAAKIVARINGLAT